MPGIRIAGTGSYLPGRPLSRDDVRRFLRRHPDGLSEAQQERLLSESGIETRHFGIDVDDDGRRESNTSMAAAAARRALDAAGWAPNDVDLLVVTTVMPDALMPPQSTLVQEALGIERCAEFALSANCTAHTKALSIAASHLRDGAYHRALVCSAQYVSFGHVPPWTNPAAMRPDQGHLRWILSDGAAAVALECGEPDIELRVCLESTGIGKKSGMSVPFGAANPDFGAGFARGDQHASQDAGYALRRGIPLVVAGLDRMLRRLEIPGTAVDHFIPSVSSDQVVEHVRPRARQLGIRDDAWRLNFTRAGYVGSVSIPIVLDELARGGELRPGDLVCTVAEESSKWMFGGTIFRWNP